MKGILYGVAAYTLWGSLPIFWKQLGDINSATIISHRIVCGFITLLPILAYRKRLTHYLRQFRNWRMIRNYSIAGLLLAVNWLIYLWATLNERVVEVALGYYILPLIYVVLGCLLLNEKLDKFKAASVFIAAAGVAIQAIGLGSIPWSALGVAFSFALYGFIKKKTESDGLTALTMELTCIAPLAAAFLMIPSEARGAPLGDGSSLTLFWLALTGLATVTPLLFFAAAAKRIKLSTLGMLQFIAPTGQFLTGWLYYNEPLNSIQMSSFALIWLAITFYSLSSLRQQKD